MTSQFIRYTLFLLLSLSGSSLHAMDIEISPPSACGLCQQDLSHYDRAQLPCTHPCHESCILHQSGNQQACYYCKHSDLTLFEEDEPPGCTQDSCLETTKVSVGLGLGLACVGGLVWFAIEVWHH